MRYLIGEEEKEAEKYMKEAVKVASGSLCLKSKCGTVVVKNGKIIGQGYNAPPLDDPKFRRCLNTYALPKDYKYDRTCCMHAEQRAIIDALKKDPKSLAGARLYFIRIDADGNIKKAGKPYCTICSRMALDAGISEFLLWHDEGICAYETGEYNALSYKNIKENT